MCWWCWCINKSGKSIITNEFCTVMLKGPQVETKYNTSNLNEMIVVVFSSRNGKKKWLHCSSWVTHLLYSRVSWKWTLSPVAGISPHKHWISKLSILFKPTPQYDWVCSQCVWSKSGKPVTVFSLQRHLLASGRNYCAGVLIKKLLNRKSFTMYMKII